jgi:hypothetical protein
VVCHVLHHQFHDLLIDLHNTPTHECRSSDCEHSGHATPFTTMRPRLQVTWSHRLAAACCDVSTAAVCHHPRCCEGRRLAVCCKPRCPPGAIPQHS